jgi:cytochrome c-type biogenesis protein CcsB
MNAQTQALAGEWLVGGLAAYVVTMVVGLAGTITRAKRVRRIGLACLVVAALVNIGALVSLGVEAGRAPFKTRYETLFLYAACIPVVCIMLVVMYRLYILTFFAALGAAACLFGAYCRPDLEFELLPPALQSAWFVPHVVTYFFAYAGLFASFVLAALALYKAWRKDGSSALAAAADPDQPIPYGDAAHKAVIFGFVALTFGLAMGAVWGKYAWGDYWQWDIKENWAFVTWLCYLTYLHLRLLPHWSGRRALWLNLASFAAVMFTYLGMNLLPAATSSLHVYQ